jgi:TadE-like protein
MRRSRGQSLVEFALLSPVLILLVMGLLDLGRAYYFEVVTTDAARDAARLGSGYLPTKWPPQGYGSGGMCDMARSDLADIISPANVRCVTNATLPAPDRPYYPGAGYESSVDTGQALVVIACPGGTFDCNGNPKATLNKNIAVTVYYHFDMVTAGMAVTFGPYLIFQNSAVFKSLW